MSRCFWQELESQGSYWNKLWDEWLSDFYEKKTTSWACLVTSGLNDIFGHIQVEILIKSSFICKDDRLTAWTTVKNVSSAKSLAVDDIFR